MSQHRRETRETDGLGAPIDARETRDADARGTRDADARETRDDAVVVREATGETPTGPADPDATVAVVDYGLGNLRSVTRGLERAGAAPTVTDDADALADHDGVVLPGVGAFREGVENAGPYREPLLDAAASGTPVLGICLGMQMLLTTSEEAERAGEGDVRGLDLVPGRNRRFDGDRPVPHMGWNTLAVVADHPLVDGVDGEHVYFVHSYYADPDDPATVVATTDYGVEFAAVVADERGTVMGTQFHPERSGDAGLRILRNFVDVCVDGL